MAFIMDPQQQQQTNFKHFCRICKKGFMCGRALGGHMRAHGIGDESGNIDDDDDAASDWEDRGGGANLNNPPANKRMYALRTNPNRLKSCRNCENCGKEFASWKSFFEHGKCIATSEPDSLISSPDSDDEAAVDGGATAHRSGAAAWSKRKRSFRAKIGNFNFESEEEDIAAKCLMLLRSATVDPSAADQPEESCASASKEEERRNPAAGVRVYNSEKAKGVAKSGGMFECKACKKVFNSHQALGGHRASHKKVKGCYAARLDHLEEDGLHDEDVITHEEFFINSSKSPFQFDNSNHISRRKSKLHECSICHRVFSSGQALGGHKRCHWITSNSPETSSLPKHNQFHDQRQVLQPKLDLNLPAPQDDVVGGPKRKALSFEICTEINLQSWIDVDGELDHHHHHDDGQINGGKKKEQGSNVEDEVESKVKLAKLCELKDISVNGGGGGGGGGGSSPWLQVGIGSTTDLGADP